MASDDSRWMNLQRANMVMTGVAVVIIAVVAILASVSLSHLISVGDAEASNAKAIGKLKLQIGSGTGSTTTTTQDRVTDGSYMCYLPQSRAGILDAIKARVWIVLGDEFAAGQGSSSPSQNSYLALLENMAKADFGYDPIVINGVGSNAQNLPEQIRSLRQSSRFSSVVASSEASVLVILSYGASWLSAQRTDSASMYELAQQIRQLDSGNSSLIKPEIASRFQVLIITNPDPVYGGVMVPEEYVQCEDSSLNRPTVASRMSHAQIMADSSSLLRQFATSRGYALIEVDQALGMHSLAQKRSVNDYTTFRTCRTFGDWGQFLLADAVWQCLHNKTYTAPAKTRN